MATVDKMPMLAEGYEKLQTDVRHLKTVERPAIIDAIEDARAHGDLSENAEYHAAKERQTYVQARISMLQKRMSDIQLINLDKIPHGKAAFGSTVHLREDTGSDVVFQLVMPEDADVDKGMISTSSPIGRAIVGKQAGDEVLVVTPNGKRSFEITKLLTVHDLA